MVSLSDGSWYRFNAKANSAAASSYAIVLLAPAIVSMSMYYSYKEDTARKLDVAIMQPNIDPYHKFQALTQDEQNAILQGQMESVLKNRNAGDTSMLLILAPETFTGGVVTNDVGRSRTYRRFRSYLSDHQDVNLLFGASSYSYLFSDNAPSATARNVGENQWVESHNSALIIDGKDNAGIYHKSKLVVGVEMTPYPAFFCKIDNLLGGVMGRCIGQDEVSLLHCVASDSTGHITKSVPLGCAICYESVYPEHCIEYVRKGARLLTVITNDAWWGDTPGYRQHLSYASLRAIETRRWIGRCGNTGISGLIDDKGRIVEKGPWWEKATLRFALPLKEEITPFVRYGDVTGRICTWTFILLLAAMIVKTLTGDRKKSARSGKKTRKA